MAGYNLCIHDICWDAQPPLHYHTVGHLIGMLGKESVYLEGVLARLMYRSLYKMHQQALHVTAKTALDMAAHLILRRTEPRIKLY
jgi:NADH:quinone reductase (non-electrogenic)